MAGILPMRLCFTADVLPMSLLLLHFVLRGLSSRCTSLCYGGYPPDALLVVLLANLCVTGAYPPDALLLVNLCVTGAYPPDALL